MMSEPSTPQQPLVSCLIPTYNQEATVEEAVRSALASVITLVASVATAWLALACWITGVTP